MIHLQHVTKRYAPNQEVLRDIEVSVPRGEMAFITGHSGAGKSTLLRLVAALERPSHGRVVVDGEDITTLSPRHIPALRRKLGFVFQDHRLLNDRTVFDNVALPLVIAGFHVREIDKRVRTALDKVDMRHRERALPATLSGGEQQRVGIARAIVTTPPILLADEPTGNLDPVLSRDIMALFAWFNQAGVTVLIASHDIDLIRRLDKRVIVLREGRCIDADWRDSPHNPASVSHPPTVTP